MRPEVWYGIGFAGQVLFSARFIVQWIASEVKKRSVIPLAFWFLSLGGSLVLLTYAAHRRDPVFIVGQSAGLIVYIRNLILIRRERAAQRAS
jgi:lipid-A-disaccharide synthase-like uncharacterized protein